MESRTNYTLVGVFAVVFLAAFALAVLWFGKFGIKDEYELYKVLATESVSGLNLEAPVKYRGVVVGKVFDIRISPRNSELIELTLKIKKGTPIRVSSIAALKPQGVTGLSFVDITPGDGKSPLLSASDGSIPVIRYSESLFSKLDSSVTSMTDKLASILFKVDSALSDKNMNEISRTIQNLQNASAELSKRMEEIGVLTEESKGLPKDAKDTLKKFSTALDAVNSAVTRMDAAAKRGDFDYKKDIVKVTDEAQKLLGDMRALVAESNVLVKDLQKNPSALIFEEKELQKGPGE